MTYREAKHVIRGYLTLFSDAQLVTLLEDARAGKARHYYAEQCLCGHRHNGDGAWAFSRHENVDDDRASYAYNWLGYLRPYHEFLSRDDLRQRRLIPMVLREMGLRGMEIAGTPKQVPEEINA